MKSNEIPCPMLKEYLSSYQAPASAEKLIPGWVLAIAIVASAAMSSVLRKGVDAALAAILILASVFTYLRVNKTRTSAMNPSERQEFSAHNEVKHLRHINGSHSLRKFVEPSVLLSLESIARKLHDARDQLSHLPPEMAEMHDKALAECETCMRRAVFAAKPLIRREQQSSRDFSVQKDDRTLVLSIVEKITQYKARIENVEAEVRSLQDEAPKSLHLRQMLDERRLAEEELDRQLNENA